MDDVLGYSGRRCIVTGAASGIGEATARILVDLGAEVHVVDTRKPEIAGLASYSETDLEDPDAITRSIDAIGAVVNNLFNCAGFPTAAPAGWHDLTERVVPLMIDGAAVTSIASGPSTEAINLYTATHAVDLISRGVRINTLNPGTTDALPDELAWPLVFLGSPRASYVTGTSLHADGGLAGRLLPPGFD